ncbi:Maltose O-acetyltransferase [Stieleria neptunia]|uniref:Acetyltransferase n=1 Tax=Stieleria neptunia TaxID=2527979 RepID=A0A518HUI4_9BACT|nr:sugar O-acetyltransferase [Stieleria neptunia]QDV44521.1 Maltose O-acetyltransferase [Stieleria neptunia]
MSEKQKMLAGQPYDPADSELTADRLHARKLLHVLNNAEPGDGKRLRNVCRELFGKGGETVWLEPPFRCDYGTNIYLGENVYFNFDCVILDVCEIRIGSNVFIGPGVHIYAATHPLDAELRRTQEFGKPVTIGNDVWVGGKAIVCPGVTIGDRSVIGAGSVVTKHVPVGVVAAGNPCQVIRKLE